MPISNKQAYIVVKLWAGYRHVFIVGRSCNELMREIEVIWGDIIEFLNKCNTFKGVLRIYQMSSDCE